MKVDLGGMLGVWVCDLEDELGEPSRTLCENATPLSTSNICIASQFMSGILSTPLAGIL